MVDFPEDPFYGPVERLENTSIILGGDLVNQPNKALYDLVRRDAFLLNLIQGAPTLVTPIPNQTSFELGNDIILDLDTFFTSSEPMTYQVLLNTDPTKLGTAIAGSNLTLSFPEWTNAFDSGQAVITVTVRATDQSSRTGDANFIVTVNELTQLFTENYFQFIYTASGSVNSGAAIYVDATERDSILADPVLSVTFTIGSGGSPVFKSVLPSNPSIPSGAIGAALEGIFRFRYIGGDVVDGGSYLYTGEAEAAVVRGNPDFLEETSPGNPAFYAFKPDVERSQRFARYRYLERNPNGDYIYSIGSENPNVPPDKIAFEGNVCRVKQIS